MISKMHTGTISRQVPSIYIPMSLKGQVLSTPNYVIGFRTVELATHCGHRVLHPPQNVPIVKSFIKNDIVWKLAPFCDDYYQFETLIMAMDPDTVRRLCSHVNKDLLVFHAIREDNTLEGKWVLLHELV